MDDRKLNEKESLELISQMIQNTKRHMELGQGNSMLLWGYTMFGITLLVYMLLLFTNNNPNSQLAWWLIPIIGGIVTFYWERKKSPLIKTYTDKILSTIWGGIGFTFFATIAMMFIWDGWALMIPLSLLYVSIGVYMMGNVLCDKWMSRLPVIGIMMSLIMLLQIFKGEVDWAFYLIVYAFCSLVILVIPGHILNHQAKKEIVCSES